MTKDKKRSKAIWNAVKNRAFRSLQALVNKCKEEAEKIEVLREAMMTCAMKNDKEGLQMLKDVCPEELESDIFHYVIRECVNNDNKEAASIIADVCPDKIASDIFHQMMYEYVNNDNKEATSMIADVCPKEIKKKIFSLTMWDFHKNGNQEAVCFLNVICPNHINGDVLGFVFAYNIDDKEKRDFIERLCPKDLRPEMFKFALGTHILHYNGHLAKKVYELCPENFKEAALSHTLSACSIDVDSKRAFDTLFDCFSDDITKNTFIDAMVQNTERNEANSNLILMDACPEEMDKKNIIRGQ